MDRVTSRVEIPRSMGDYGVRRYIQIINEMDRATRAAAWARGTGTQDPRSSSDVSRCSQIGCLMISNPFLDPR